MLTDDPDLTYEAAMSRFSSSVLFEGEEIAMYEIVFLGVGEL